MPDAARFQPVRLRFVSGLGWDSRVIEYQTRCKWSHVEAVLDRDRETFGAQLRGGVAYRYAHARCYRNAGAMEIVEIPATGSQAALFWSFLERQNGKPYDWRAIVSFGLGQRDWDAPDSWICSELQAAALRFASLLYIPKSLPVERITPRDLWMLVCSSLRRSRFAS